jgi:hypothetical protein
MSISSTAANRRLHAALVATALMATSPAAMAVIRCGFSAPVIPIPNSNDGVYINFLNGNTGSFGATVAGWDFNPYNNGTGTTFFAPLTAPPVVPLPQGILSTGTPGTTAEARVLLAGDLVTPTPAIGFYNTGITQATSFRSSGVRFLGLRFYNESNDTMNYGWAEIETGAGSGIDAGFPATVSRFCFENSGLPITVGTLPVTLQTFSID